MKYTASWTANNSTYGSFEGNNLRTVAKVVRDICKGNVFAGNQGRWSITENIGDVNAEIKSGTIRG